MMMAFLLYEILYPEISNKYATQIRLEFISQNAKTHALFRSTQFQWNESVKKIENKTWTRV